MRGLPVDQIVYEHLFPNPKPTDPQNFEAFVQRKLLAEIRDEAKAFYGTLDTQEAKYPGIDYLHSTHRLRLSRWPWHQRLFRAFNALRLTPAEICGLTKWEGTKWAKEKFEKEHGIIIKDTTGDDIVDWVPPSPDDAQIPRAPPTNQQTDFGKGEGEQREQQPLLPDTGNGEECPTSVDQGDRHSIPEEAEEHQREQQQEREQEQESDNDDDDDEFVSVGVDLNERLRDRATRRDAGDTSVVLDEQWEQWLKNAIDSGELTLLTEQMTEQMVRRASTTSVVPAALIPPGMLFAARSGQWSEIPEVLHPMLLRTLEAASPSPSPSPRSRPGVGAGLVPRTGVTGLSDSVTTRYLTMPRPTRPTIRLPSAQDAF